jgi:large subunit ribosomal protein L1
MAGKKYREALKQIDREKRYPLEEALKLVIANKVAKFDETVELAVRLNVDPRQADQNVRGTVVLPNGTGKVERVLLKRYRKRTGSSLTVSSRLRT